MIKVVINTVKDKIYTIRGQQVMLDRDLAELYGVKAKRLREQIRRNDKQFPEDFMFQLTENEVDFMVSQNATPSRKYLGGSLPLVFTEQGVANISSVLTNDRAIEVKEFNKSHDRFLIIDRKDIYHIGASLKDLGKKWFGFSKFKQDSFPVLEELK